MKLRSPRRDWRLLWGASEDVVGADTRVCPYEDEGPG